MKPDRSLLVVTLVALLTSCVNIAQPPQEWPKAVTLKNDTCISLTGFYINKGIEAPANKDKAFHERNPQWAVYLSELLIPYIPDREFVEHKWADTIELSGVMGGELEIALKKNKKIVFKKILNENADFTCSSEYLVMKDTSSIGNKLGMTATGQFKKTTFSMAIDGSILVSKQEIEVGTILIIPAGSKVLQRYRFLPVDSPK